MNKNQFQAKIIIVGTSKGIYIPSWICHTLNLNKGDKVEIIINEGNHSDKN